MANVECASFCNVSAESCVSSYALGMESRAISDYQITASDYYRITSYSCPPQNSRLNNVLLNGKLKTLRTQILAFTLLCIIITTATKLIKPCHEVTITN